MAQKRKSDISPSGNKRQRTDPSLEKPKVNRVYGQTSAFPGLTDTQTEVDLFVDNVLSDNPIQYLKHVRAQASRIPTLLTASEPHKKDDGLIYDDGAIIAAPFIGPTPPPAILAVANNSIDTEEELIQERWRMDGELDPDEDGNHAVEHYDDAEYGADAHAVVSARTAYHTRLVSEYYRVQSLISASSSAKNIEEQPEQIEDELVEIISCRNPTPTYLARLPDEKAFQALHALLYQLRWRALIGMTASSKRLSAWCWGLLARLDVRRMNYEGVGRVRELAKKAIALLERAPRSLMNTKQTEPAAAPDELYETLSPTDRDPDDIEGSIARGFIQVKGATCAGELNLLRIWMHAVEGLQELMWRLHQVNGDVNRLGDDDQDTFRQTVHMARVEFQKQRTAVEQGNMAAEAEKDEEHREGDEEELARDEGETFADGDREAGLLSAYATLDMILTVVGEVFGQRDLLEIGYSRDVCWQVDSEPTEDG